MARTFLTFSASISDNKTQAVEDKLDGFGNPVSQDIREALDGSSVHFMSVNVLPADADSGHGAFLVVETSQDGSKDDAIKDLAKRLNTPLRDILALAGHTVAENDLAKFIEDHSHDTGWGLLSTPGLNHTGTPGLTEKRIEREKKFGEKVREIVTGGEVTGSPLEILNEVKTRMQGLSEFQDLMSPEDVAFADSRRGASVPLAKLVMDGLKTFAWPYLIVLGICLLWVIIASFSAMGFWFAVGMAVLTLIAGVLVMIIIVGILYSMLRTKERTDPAEDFSPDFDVLSAVMARENDGSVNHLYGISKMKPGKLRRITLRFAFWFIAQMATHVFRPGYLGKIGTIHFARWILLPGTDKLLFFSNFGGSWESYLEDFITKASSGLTGVWSNTEHYPRTENLFFKGATDGDRFKRWARRQQRPTLFWYSAYPNATTDLVRRNALIRYGLLKGSTESQAREWLSLLGSRRMPANALETDEIQSILFGGMGALNQASCLLIQLPDDQAAAKQWLRAVQPHVSFGDRPPHEKAALLAMTATGLSKLGLKDSQLASFPAVFRQGMDEPVRAEFVLKDTGDDKPDLWWWGHDGTHIDAAVIVYAEEAGLADAAKVQEDLIAAHNCKLIHKITSKPGPGKNGGLEKEAFGFADGISQPIIKGSRRSIDPDNAIHVVEPGEFILGYPDNRNYMPTSPILPASDDPKNILLSYKPEAEQDDWPDFAASEARSPRNFGRNGSYLVIRQLEQDVPAFHAFSEAAAKEIKGRQGTPPGANEDDLQEWVEAKMVGRWKDGTSLVRYPFKPGGGAPDNDFLFGEDDPSGFRCPFGAHIRRANPRESLHPQDGEEELSITNRHRILRMGRQYDQAGAGNDAADNPGLLFMCLNGNLERQFEFVQQTWCMDRLFHGLDGEVDSVLGRGRKGGRLTIPTPEGPLIVSGMKDFVKVRGGSYFFMPGASAIRYLAD